ncbi:PREDICTED: uncharacterized protein LOC106926907 [Poecilia mexicana]|uniref:uncharacterized protein LOC106926907 n=1 Tax=Poecilia mexicana TaxID=48701 RepID=UPI00072E4016|nr:PREDICTED: uncharacterized protein LOC106926907 [Poecilia mexicana]
MFRGAERCLRRPFPRTLTFCFPSELVCFQLLSKEGAQSKCRNGAEVQMKPHQNKNRLPWRLQGSTHQLPRRVSTRAQPPSHCDVMDCVLEAGICVAFCCFFYIEKLTCSVAHVPLGGAGVLLGGEDRNLLLNAEELKQLLHRFCNFWEGRRTDMQPSEAGRQEPKAGKGEHYTVHAATTHRSNRKITAKVTPVVCGHKVNLQLHLLRPPFR